MLRYTARRPQTNVNVSGTPPLKEFFLLAGGLLALAVGAYVLLGLAVDLVAPRLSVDFEKKLAAAMMRDFPVAPERRGQQEKLQALADRLQRQCARLPYEFKVHLHPAGQFNAVALPGGHIVVFSRLFDAAASENELAFVLAHEMGHYAHRDHLRAMGRGLVLVAVSAALFGADSGVSEVLGNGLRLTELGFSRAQETRADEFALEALACTYGHVGGALEFMAKFPAEADPGRVGHYFSTHPETRRRIAHLQSLIRTRRLPAGPLPSPVPDGEIGTTAASRQ